MIKGELLKEMKGSEKYVLISVVFQWIVLISQIIASISISILLANLYLRDVIFENVAITVAIVISTIFIRLISEKVIASAAYKASYDVKNKLRRDIYNKVISLGPSYRQKVSTSELIQLSVDGIEQLEIYYGRYLPQFLYSLIAPITLFFVVGTMSWSVSLVLLICVPLIPASIIFVQKIAKRLLKRYWGEYTQLGDDFLENIQGLTTLKIYKSDCFKADEMDVRAESFRKITMRVLTMQLNSISVMDLIAFGGAAIGIVLSVSKYGSGEIELWQAISIILLAAEFFIPLRLLGSFFHIAMNGMAASDRIFSFLKQEENKDSDNLVALEDNNISISFKDVSFGYEEGKTILKKVNLDIENGSFISIVGESGSGKSTISSLISGKYKTYDGSIEISGADLRKVSEKSLLDKITTVKYNSYIFGGTVYDNLRMAGENVGEESMINALKIVNLWDFLSNESGLDTVLLEQGSNLSGGQKQRLAFARAILKDSPMYIFDEASSNIDVESEEIIMSVIKEMAKTKTVLLISHRMINVVDSDRIYVVSNGEIVESGNHRELMTKEGAYHELFTTQKKLSEKRGDRYEA